MLSNGHVWYGYEDGDHVPSLPLVTSIERFEMNKPYVVKDADGYLLAAFRNKADYERFVKDTENRFSKKRR